MFDFTRPIRVQKQIIFLNAVAALVNLALATNNFAQGRWIGIANLAAGAFSVWVTWGCWKKLPEIVAKEQQKIVDILSGKFG